MAETGDDRPLAPRRTLGGPILPPPPPEIAEQAEQAQRAERERVEQARIEEARADQRARDKAQQQAAKDAQKQAEKQARGQAAEQARQQRAAERSQRAEQKSQGGAPMDVATATTTAPAVGKAGSARRTRRAQLRLVQVDAWSVMKTSFLLSIALGIVLVVAVAIIWSVLGAAGVWDSINSIVQQAVGNDTGKKFDITQYAGTSRVLGFTMIVAVVDVILITAISTLGAFLYNLSAALLGGIEVTLAEDS